MVAFFNTLGHAKQKFAPLQAGKVGLYSCGPTVYNFAHIGNLSTFIWVDVLKRYLGYRGFQVTHVMNLTDVDDKTINGARREGTSLRKFTERYSEYFFGDLATLGIEPATIYPRATEYIPEMVAIIKKLLEKGFAYRANDGSIYYRISSFPTYGELAGMDMSELRTGASGVLADEYQKEDVADFALWKAWNQEQDGDVFWETEIGKGRPGWHIECSAMSMKHLGETFDIHTGGVDLIFPHHQNEIAQSEAATGKQFVRYWLHRQHLMVDGAKMSKSLGNMKTLKDVVSSPLDAAAFRYLIVSNHYRSQLNFTGESFAAAKNTVLRLRNFWSRLSQAGNDGASKIDSQIETARQCFVEAMDDDLNTPKAVAAVFKLIDAVEKIMAEQELTRLSATAVKSFIEEVDSVLGVIRKFFIEQEVLPTDIAALIEKRNVARASQNWQEADNIRQQLLAQGIQLEDAPSGTKWRRVS